MLQFIVDSKYKKEARAIISAVHKIKRALMRSFVVGIAGSEIVESPAFCQDDWELAMEHRIPPLLYAMPATPGYFLVDFSGVDQAFTVHQNVYIACQSDMLLVMHDRNR